MTGVMAKAMLLSSPVFLLFGFAIVGIFPLAEAQSDIKFIAIPPKPYLLVPVGFPEQFNCTTNNTNDSLSLIYVDSMRKVRKELPVDGNRLVLVDGVFTFYSISLKDAGQYLCKAKRGSNSHEKFYAHLFPSSTVSPNSKPTIFPSQVELHNGDKVTLTCKIPVGFILTWEKRKTPISKVWLPAPSFQVGPEEMFRSPTGKPYVKRELNITNAQYKAEPDYYRCVGTFRTNNRNSTAYATISYVKPVKPTIHVSPKNVTANATANSFTLKCIIEEASPRPVLKWFVSGIPSPIVTCNQDLQLCEKSSKDYSVYNQGETLLVKKVTAEVHGSKFTCKVENEKGMDSGYSTVYYQVPPKLEKKSSIVLMETGVSGNVTCRTTDGYPNPTFKWHYQAAVCLQGKSFCDPKDQAWKPVHDQFPQNPPADVPTTESTVLVPENSKDAHFRCTASNVVGSDMHVLFLKRTQVRQDKLLYVKPDQVKADEGSSFSISCIVDTSIYKSLFWNKDGKRLDISSATQVTEVVTTKGSEITSNLSFTNAKTTDRGNYTCIGVRDTDINLPTATSTSSIITVLKLVKPKIESFPNVTVFMHNSSKASVLQCKHVGYPPPRITWLEDGKPVSASPMAGNNPNEFCKKATSYFLVDKDKLVICQVNTEYNKIFTCYIESRLGNDTKDARMTVLAYPEIKEPIKNEEFETQENSKIDVVCEAAGYPEPSITWYKIEGKTRTRIHSDHSNQTGHLFIEEPNLEHSGDYMCLVENYLGNASSVITLSVVPPVVSSKILGPLSEGELGAVIVSGVVFVLIVAVGCYFIASKRKEKQLSQYMHNYLLRSTSYQLNPDMSILEQCDSLGYDPEWEFPFEKLVLGENLGSGAFGQVIKADAIGMLAFNPRDRTTDAFRRRSKLRRSMNAIYKLDADSRYKLTEKVPVAVKTVKDSATEQDYKDLAAELKIMIHIGEHQNLVNLLGACTKGNRLCLILEFCPHGNLLNFLRDRREMFDPRWAKTQNNPNEEFTIVDLAMAVFQVARGLEFLANKRCVHRDLAARNILVGGDYVMKVADFGLARDVYQDEMYVKTTSGLLPVKWMSPESLYDRIYTHQTDVWSYGILLWEVFTLGGSPYPGLPAEELLDFLQSGKRMPCPQHCPVEMYTIMRDCWLEQPDQRPTFTQLVERVGRILEKNVSRDNPYLTLDGLKEEAPPASDQFPPPTAAEKRSVAGGDKRGEYYLTPTDAKDAPDGKQPRDRYDSPIPSLPPGMPEMDDSDIMNSPLPPIPDSPTGDDEVFVDKSRNRSSKKKSSSKPNQDNYVECRPASDEVSGKVPTKKKYQNVPSSEEEYEMQNMSPKGSMSPRSLTPSPRSTSPSLEFVPKKSSPNVRSMSSVESIV